jgi:cytochrome b561
MSQRATVANSRYSPTAQILHWITAMLIFITIPLAWVMVNMPPSAHLVGRLFTLHESIGLTILAIVAVRLIWRATHPAPPLPTGLARWDKLVARVSHWMLYVILAGMPLSGYLMNATGGYPISFYWLCTVPGLPRNIMLADFGEWLHLAIGQWVLYALIALHIAATIWHVAVRRDGILNRMIPPQS